MNLKQVYEGWKNYLLPDEKKKAFIEEVSDHRMSICNKCEENSENKKNYSNLRPDAHCTKCGCTLAPKTKCLSCKCPLEKWDSVIEPEYE